MYVVKHNKNKFKMKDKDELTTINGILFGSKNKSYKIAGQQVKGLKLYHKKLAYPIAKKQVDTKYNKLITLITELLVSDDDTGSCYHEVLNQIEKFRQIIKNKYRIYLKRQELELMSKNLMFFQKEAKNKLIEFQNNAYKSMNTRSSCK